MIKKTFKDLENAEIKIKKNNANKAKITGGFLERPLIGSVLAKGQAVLFKLSNIDTEMLKGANIASEKTYILTDKASSWTGIVDSEIKHSDFLCRVVKNNTQYDDDSCKLLATQNVQTMKRGFSEFWS